jgi:multidrug efflux pump
MMISLTIMGLYALIMMPKEASPDVSIPYGIVSVGLPGATALDVERLIVDKLEPALQNVANVDKTTSTARQGLAAITVQFNQDADLNIGIQDLRSALERVKYELPSDATTPVVTKVDTSDQPVLTIAISSPLAPETLTSLGENLKDTLSTIGGVAKVEVSGVRDREISIIINKDALARYKISPGQIVGALRGANTGAPVGALTIDGVEYPVQFKGEITSIDDIRKTPITTQSGTVRIGDVATVIDGYAPTQTISHLGVEGGESTYALTLYIYKSKGGSILKVSEAIQEKLDSLKETLLKGSDAIITYDAAKEVRTNISDLTRAGLDTVLLVMIVLFVAIGFREAIVSALAIPLSFVIAFIGMWLTGNTINFLSLFSLIIAIGILVDSGIVVVEAIHTNREKGMDKVAAARRAIQQYAWPLIAGTLTTVAVFFPLFFLSGIIGEYMQSIPFTVIVVLLASIVVALGFVPLIALGFLKHEESAFAVRREQLWVRISAWYRGKMSYLFNDRKAQKRFLGFLIASFVFAMSLPITGMLKVSMFPAADQEFFYAEIELPEASTLKATEIVAEKAEALIEKHPDVASYTTTVGASSFFSSSGSASNAKYANITINLRDDRSKNSIAVAGDIRESLKSLSDLAKISVTESVGGPPSGAPITIKVWGDDSGALGEGLERVERIVRETAGTRDTASSLDTDGTGLAVTIDREKANDYGLSAYDIATLLQTGVTGTEVTTVRIGGDDIDVRMKLALNGTFTDPQDTSVADIDALAAIPVTTSRGMVPLGSFVSISAERSATAITHEDGDRLGTVSAYLITGANAVEVTNNIRKAIEADKLPDGVRVTYGGDTEDIAKTFTEMIAALIAGIVLMFAILVLEFNAFRTSGRLLLAIPLSLTGVLIGLWITGQPLSLTAMLGIIALGGVLINHGILLLDVLNTNRREHADASPEDIVLGAATTRIRPILLTTITTIVGMIPLVFVSAMWAPLAYTIAFGLLYGTVLTLIFIPLLSYRQEIKSRLKN